jgi:peptidoglycan/xylan/chitin deacetylase (PgdA/CDA1 family)
MQVPRVMRKVLLGGILLAVAINGHATADTSTPAGSGPPAGPAASAPVRPPTAQARPRPERTAVPFSDRRTGPAGARMTTGSRGVALTFDDGPDPRLTPQILRLLAQHRVRATFCVVGRNVQRHPALIRQMVAGGHTLCNHSWDHSMKIGTDPVARIRADLWRTNAAIRRAAPQARIRYFRAPGGRFTPRLVGVARGMGITSIHWKVDPRDWEHPAGESRHAHRRRLIRCITKDTRPGAIVLSHDYAQPDTIAVYRSLLPWLRKRYQLIPL